MTPTGQVRVAVNGYGVIGKRVADAVALQDDMELAGVADVVSDYRIRVAVERSYAVYASAPERRAEMEAAGIPVAGNLDELRDALWDAPRIAFVRATDGLVSLNSVIELMRDLDRPRGDMWEVAVWEDALAADDREVYLTLQVHNEAIVVPENVDCIRALTGLEADGAASIAKTNQALGITKTFLPATTRPITHLLGHEVTHPAIVAVRATHGAFMDVGFKGAEEPTEPIPTAEQQR